MNQSSVCSDFFVPLIIELCFSTVGDVHISSPRCLCLTHSVWNPRKGFLGGIDSSLYDRKALSLELARKLPRNTEEVLPARFRGPKWQEPFRLLLSSRHLSRYTFLHSSCQFIFPQLSLPRRDRPRRSPSCLVWHCNLYPIFPAH